MDLSQYNFLTSYRNKWYLLVLDVSILTVLGLLLLKIGDLLKNVLQNYKFIVDSPETIKQIAFFFFLVSLFVLVKILWRWLVDSHKRNCLYKFKNQDWPEDWIFNGKTETLPQIDQLYVKSSRAGCLLKTHLWQNFRMSFEMKFGTDLMKNLGIIFRAEDLDNYFMLEVFREDYGSSNGTPIFKSGIKPHVRFNGGWELIHREIYNELDFSDFTSVALEVENNISTFFYRSNPIFKWILPTHIDVNHIETGFKQDERANKTHIFGKSTAGNVQEIPFRLCYGMVGFRAHPGQGAIIKNLTVEPF